ncbi:hypothetical protein BOX15_Mlig011059g2 [Macrostomum lignano]|uniref:C-type lectin domain-containing protein n=1 Tax=Macrostomum lignano TaxID=282301 RepID=A0A267GG94_9PLAT|nr:hypothetical protein BOX15_Mlig011059g2 [Macrostomum lignano]
MPQFEANFNEANFYCQRNSSQLASVLTQSELDFVNKLSFGIDSCESAELLDSVWLGLIKLNPCFPDSAGRELCYQWTDFSGKHDNKLPAWETGHPDSADWTVNCVTLSAGRLRSDRCHSRHRFVCKTEASDGTSTPDGGVTSAPDGGVTSAPDGGVTSAPDGGVTSTPDGGVTSAPDGGVTSAPDGGVTSAPDGGVTPPVDGLVAAFDFRRGLDNLVDPRTFAIEDQFGVERSAEDGACFKWNSTYPFNHSEFYNVGAPVAFNESIWNAAEWTMYFRLSRSSGINAEFVSVLSDYSNPFSYFSFFAWLYSFSADIFYLTSFQGIHPGNIRHRNDHVYRGSGCAGSWCDIRLAMKNSILDSPSIGEPLRVEYRNWTSGGHELGLQQLRLGD